MVFYLAMKEKTIYYAAIGNKDFGVLHMRYLVFFLTFHVSICTYQIINFFIRSWFFHFIQAAWEVISWSSG